MEVRVPLPAALAAEVSPARDPLAALAGLPGAFALRSSLPDRGAVSRRARWSYFGAEPFAEFRGGDTAAALATYRTLAANAGPPELARELGVPFAGGIVGYWAYDYGRRLERLPERARDDLGLPDHVLAFHDVVIARDEDTQRTWILSSGLPAPAEDRAERARARLDTFRRRLESRARPRPAAAPARAPRQAAS